MDSKGQKHQHLSAGSWVETEATTTSAHKSSWASLIKRGTKKKSSSYLTRNTKFSAESGPKELNTKLMANFTAPVLSKTVMSLLRAT